MSLEAKIGYYKMRNGNIAHVFEEGTASFPFHAKIKELDGTQLYYPGGFWTSVEGNEYDLIEYLGEELPANPPLESAPEVKDPALEASAETTFTTVKPESQNNPLENMLVERAEKERRDNFAIEAMKALIRNRAHQSVDDLCDMAYAFADSMIERSKE